MDRTYSQEEVIERVLIDVLQLVLQGKRVVSQGLNMGHVQEVCATCETWSTHIGLTDCFYFLNTVESFMSQQLEKEQIYKSLADIIIYPLLLASLIHIQVLTCHS